MKNLIKIGKDGRSTMGILRQELDHIEHATGYRPEDWMYQMYDEAYEEYWCNDSFDWEGFEMHISCLADSFIEFIAQHYQNLNNNIYC